MIIKALTENTAADPSFLTEHGLSLYIETSRHKILFDTGQSPAFAENAAKLNVDLSLVDLAVLSHAHYDHGGGLKTFLSLNSHAPVYLSQYAFENYLHGEEDYIGLDRDLRGNPRFVLVKDNVKLDEGLRLLTGKAAHCGSRSTPPA